MSLVSDAKKQMEIHTNKLLKDNLRALEQLTGKSFYYYLDDKDDLVYEVVNVEFTFDASKLEYITKYYILDDIFNTFFLFNFHASDKYDLKYMFDYNDKPEEIIISITPIFKNKNMLGVKSLKYEVPIPSYLLKSVAKIEEALLSTDKTKAAIKEYHIKCYWEELEKLKKMFSFLAEQ